VRPQTIVRVDPTLKQML